MIRINPNLRPRGGFKFIDADNVTHAADDINMLVGVLTQYRERVGRPAGEPRTEIEDQLCKRHPALCKNAGGHNGIVRQNGTMRDSHASPTPEQTALAIHVAFNIKQAGRYAGGNVGPGEADLRATICHGCPHRVNWTVGCKPCMLSAAGKTDAALFPLPVVATTRHMACGLAKDSLELAVWRANGRRIKNAPLACWRPLP